MLATGWPIGHVPETAFHTDCQAPPGPTDQLHAGPDRPLLQLQASLAAALGDGRAITDVPHGRAWLSSVLA